MKLNQDKLQTLLQIKNYGSVLFKQPVETMDLYNKHKELLDNGTKSFDEDVLKDSSLKDIFFVLRYTQLSNQHFDSALKFAKDTLKAHQVTELRRLPEVYCYSKIW